MGWRPLRPEVVKNLPDDLWGTAKRQTEAKIGKRVKGVRLRHLKGYAQVAIIDNFSFGLEIRGMDKDARKAKSIEVLQKVGLDGWAEHFPRELSGGMQQREGVV